MARRRDSSNDSRKPLAPIGSPELILVAQSDPALRMTPEGFVSRSGANVTGLAAVLNHAGISVTPLFGVSEDRILERRRDLGLDDSPLSAMETYYHIESANQDLNELADRLRRLDEVAGAYVKPAASLPVAIDLEIERALSPSDTPPAATTPDFRSNQIYLNPAPEGVDARFAWRYLGGRGMGVNIIDCEWGWRFNHEDLLQNQGGVVIGSAISDDNHGTAVAGEISGDQNPFGIEGICSDARFMAASFATLPTAAVIRQAADRLRPGDIILLEIHRPGPGANGTGQDGFIAIEWWPDDLAAIRYAVAKGIIVVEAAGNGARNLDSAIYNSPATGFPTSWRNPFNIQNPTSGAVLVGAGAPPPGTHGRDHGPDRSRLDFSNYGARVDAQGWGREVTSTGYGDLQGGSEQDRWYTDQFSGTSSASPIVVGVIGCLQGILRARHKPLLTPARTIQILRSTGSPQQDAPGRPRTQRIGNRPNLRQMIRMVHPLLPDLTQVSDANGSSIETDGASIFINSGHTSITIRPLQRASINADSVDA